MDDLFTWKVQLDRIGGAYAPNTIRAYYADVGDFVDWCGAGDLRPFPLEDAALIDFVNAQSRHNKYATIRRKLVALRRVNRLLGHSDPAPSEDFAIALRRVRRGQSAAKRQARGINRDLLLRMIDAQPDTVASTRNRAMLSLGYDFLARRSELASIRTSDVAFLPGGGLRGRIRRGKTDQFGAGRLVYGSRRSGELLRAWLKISPGNYQWLFRPVSPGIAGDRPISGLSVGTVIKKSVVAVRGLRPREHEVSGHSLRVGAGAGPPRRGPLAARNHARGGLGQHARREPLPQARGAQHMGRESRTRIATAACVPPPTRQIIRP